MHLLSHVPDADPVCEQALETYYGGKPTIEGPQVLSVGE